MVEYITIKEAKKYLTYSQIYYLVKSGQIRTTGSHKTRRFCLEDVVTIANTRKTGYFRPVAKRVEQSDLDCVLSCVKLVYKIKSKGLLPKTMNKMNKEQLAHICASIEGYKKNELAKVQQC